MSENTESEVLSVATNDGVSQRACVECAEDINTEAKKCRHCGAYQRKSARWLGPLVTILSLLIAILSLMISSKDQIVDLFYPQTALFAAIEPSETATARLVVHNESGDSVVIENMMCFLKLTADMHDDRYVDSFWEFDSSSIIAPGSVFEADIQWMGSGISEERTDSRADAPIPFEFDEVRRWSSSCACDPERDMDETLLDPATVCRVYFRSSRKLENHYDFRAGYLEVLESIRRQELDLPQIPVLQPDQLTGSSEVPTTGEN